MISLPHLSGLIRRAAGWSASSPRRRRAWLVVGALAAWLVGGCANTGGDYSYVTTISTGERLTFPLVRGRPELARAGTITVRAAGLARPPGKDVKEVTYEFVFEDKSGAKPKAVRIDDVTERKILPILEDLHPAMDKQFWMGSSKSLAVDDPLLSWLPYLDDTVRVFRFTITAADGHEVVLYQAWMVPAFVKMGVRAAMGMK